MKQFLALFIEPRFVFIISVSVEYVQCRMPEQLYFLLNTRQLECLLILHITVISKYKYIYFFFFGAILKPVLKFLYQNGKHGCIFFAVHRTVFSQCIKMHTIICHHLSQHCTALPSLCPGFHRHHINSTLMVWLLLTDAPWGELPPL